MLDFYLISTAGAVFPLFINHGRGNIIGGEWENNGEKRDFKDIKLVFLSKKA